MARKILKRERAEEFYFIPTLGINFHWEPFRLYDLISNLFAPSIKKNG